MPINTKRSYTEYVVSSEQSEFTIGFKDYQGDAKFTKDVINVTVDDIDATTAGYTVTRTSPTVITLTPAVPVTTPNKVVRLQRETNIDTSFHVFTNGAKWDATTMDENFEQVRHSQQEVRDGFDKLYDDVIPLVIGLEEALAQAAAASQAAQDAAEAAESAAANVLGKVRGFDTIAALRASTRQLDGEFVAVSRYYSTSLDGGGAFVHVVGDTVTADNGGTVIVGADGSRWYRLYETLSFKDFGAVGDGVTIDTTAVASCLSWVLNANAVIEDYTYGQYYIDQNLSVAGANRKFTIRGNAKIVSNTNYVTFTGSISQVGNISAAASRGARTVTLNTTPSLSAGDILFIQNTRPYSFNAYRDYYFDGEVREVKSVSGSVVTLTSVLETSYLSGVEDKVFKLSPIDLDIDGVVFDCNGFAGLRIQLAARSTFNMEAYNRLNLTNASYGIVFDRCYDCKMTGGRGVKLGLGNSGTDYGIVLANCQDMYIYADYAYGERHGGAMGGGTADGSVPNRRCWFIGTHLDNAQTVGYHVADIHGNAKLCGYKDCYAESMLGLGGEDVFSIRNIVKLPNGETRSPIFVTEASGKVTSIGDTFIDTASATSLMGWASSVTAATNTKPYAFELRDAIIGKTVIIGLMNATTVNNVDSRFIIDGFEFLESFSTVTRLLTYTNLNTSQKPSYVQVTNPKNALPDTMIIIAGDANLAGVKKRIFGFTVKTASNGTYTVLEDGTMIARHSINYTGAVQAAYGTLFKQDTNSVWVYPRAFVGDLPEITVSSGDANVDSTKYTARTTAQVQLYGISHRSYSNAAVNMSVTATGRYLT